MRRKKELSILDVTIRDGSYPIDYQYTPEQVEAIALSLDGAGIHYIEVSHGCGLGAAENMGYPAAATDVEYVQAAKRAAQRAKIGVIAGPAPVTQEKDIDSIIEHVDFIRFAANCDDPKTIVKNASYALKLRPDLPLFLQLMRSTRRKTKELLSAARFAESLGFSTVYIVDTAGHYLPEEVGEIVSTLVAKLDIRVGFHGHNNLGLANANTLSAVAAGAVFIDASLKGLGRSGGNAQLEAIVSLLKRMGFAKSIDLDTLIHAGQELVVPLMPAQYGVDAIDLFSADANIDLSPLEIYEKIALAGNIELHALVRALGREATAVEIGPEDVARALQTLGANPARVFSRTGIPFVKPKKHPRSH